MEVFNRRGPAEKEEEQEEQRFLNGESSKQTPNKRYRNIPKEEKQ
jgi:hypothetical protein